MSEPTHPETAAVRDAVELETLTERLAGRNGGLRTSKPDTDADTGLTQYVWRIATFHAGHNTSMPVTASWWLQDWLDANDIDAAVAGVLDDAGDGITTYLHDVAIHVLRELGENPNRAAQRWTKAGVV